MNWRRYFAVIALLLGVVLGCATRPLAGNTLVLAYEDFGPGVMASNLLGQAWWQWQPEGDGNPATRYPIKVVVYWNVPLDKVKQAYPVMPEKKQDYRYVERNKALAFLDSSIQDAKDFQFGQNHILTTLQTTQKKISKGSDE
jgi:hypothetical protein